MKGLIILLVMFTSELPAMEKPEFQRIMDMIQESKYAEAKTDIDNMKNKYSEDPEYYVLLFNYYFSKAGTSRISIQQSEPENSEYLELLDSSKNKSGWYIGEHTIYDSAVIAECVALFKPALKKFPNRLDLFFGLAYVAHECKLFEELKFSLIEILRLSRQNNNEWLWSFNEKMNNDPKAFMFDNIQGHLEKLWQEDTPSSDSLFIEVSTMMIEYYPVHIFGYNNLGGVYYSKKDYDKALPFFVKAEEIDPKDIIVLRNLANLYKNKNDFNAAEKYYNKVIELGNESDKKWAEESIKLLNNN